MSEDATPVQPQDSEQSEGGLGAAVTEVVIPGLPESLRPVGIRDTRMIERAIRERWPMPDEDVKRALIERQTQIALESPNDREATSAFKSLVSASKLNVDIAKLEADQAPKEMHHTHSGAIEHYANVRQELLGRPELLDEARAIECEVVAEDDDATAQDDAEQSGSVGSADVAAGGATDPQGE